MSTVFPAAHPTEDNPSDNRTYPPLPLINTSGRLFDGSSDNSEAQTGSSCPRSSMPMT